MSEELKIPWEELPFDKLDKEQPKYKSIFVFHPVILKSNISDKRIAITDSGLKLEDIASEIAVVNAYGRYLKSTFAIEPNSKFITNNFATPRKVEFAFDLHERAWTLRVAIQILSGKPCLTNSFFIYDDSKNPADYFKPFISRESHFLRADESIEISGGKYFETLNRVYLRLLEVKIYDYSHENFSKLLNATRFFARMYQSPDSFLEKIVDSFIALESLFTDKSMSEVTYKVATRAAFFLYPSSPDRRRELFELLKIAYDARSSYVHGSRVDDAALTRKLQTLKKNPSYSLWYDLPIELYAMLAQILLKILTSDPDFAFFSGEPSSSEQADYYSTLVLGA